MKWSCAYENGKLAEGAEPFPIVRLLLFLTFALLTRSVQQLTAVRHERPWRDWKSKEEAFNEVDDHTSAEHQAKDAWWQWFEINPVEVGCEELEGWLPLWGASSRSCGTPTTDLGARLPSRFRPQVSADPLS